MRRILENGSVLIRTEYSRYILIMGGRLYLPTLLYTGEAKQFYIVFTSTYEKFSNKYEKLNYYLFEIYQIILILDIFMKDRKL